MRVSSLSDPRVIDLVTKYFVPAWVSRDFYQLEGDNKDEKAEIFRLDRDRHDRGLKGGNVCVFLVGANGNVLATMPVQQAQHAENLVPFLEKFIEENKLKPREEKAVRASAAKQREWKPKTEDGRIVQIWTRQDTGPNLGLGNDHVELTAAEWKAFLPPRDAQPGKSWQIPEKVAHKLFQYGYPPSSNWALKDCQVRKGTLKATLEGSSEAGAIVQLEGEMELCFPVGKPTEGHITARFVGLARTDRDKKNLSSLLLVSEKADYVWYWQGKPSPRKMRIALEMEP